MRYRIEWAISRKSQPTLQRESWPYMSGPISGQCTRDPGKQINVEIVGILTNKTGKNSIRNISDHL